MAGEGCMVIDVVVWALRSSGKNDRTMLSNDKQNSGGLHIAAPLSV